MAYTVLEYLTADGVSPFAKWRITLDVHARVRIDSVVERFYDGNLGDHKGVGAGVIETRIDAGPGFRIYYGRDGDALVILLAGGTKKTQAKDIEAAKDRWKDYKDRKRRGS
jgi:putative addiction module killer protein